MSFHMQDLSYISSRFLHKKHILYVQNMYINKTFIFLYVLKTSCTVYEKSSIYLPPGTRELFLWWEGFQGLNLGNLLYAMCSLWTESLRMFLLPPFFVSILSPTLYLHHLFCNMIQPPSVTLLYSIPSLSLRRDEALTT